MRPLDYVVDSSGTARKGGSLSALADAQALWVKKHIDPSRFRPMHPEASVHKDKQGDDERCPSTEQPDEKDA